MSASIWNPANPVNASTAALIQFTPAAGISATNVQAAIEEVVSDTGTSISAAITALLARFADASTIGDGDALVAVKRAETGATATTQHILNQALPWYPVPFNGAVGDDTTDDTVKLQAALDASLYVDLGDSRYKYKITDKLNLRIGHVIKANGAEIRQATNNKEIFNYESKSDILIYGVVGRGVGTDYSDSDSSRSVFAYGGTTGSNINISLCKLYNFSYTSLRAAANTNIKFGHNYVEGPGAPTLTPITSGKCYGVLTDAGCVDVQIYGNKFTKTAQGIRIESTIRFNITGNIIYDIVGQHGMYLGSGLSDGAIHGNTIDNIDLIGIKVQAANAAAVDNKRIAITGNTINNCGDQGILLCNGAGSTAQTYKCRNMTVTGNNISNVAGAAINAQNTVIAVIANNTCDTPGFNGISLSACDIILVDSNGIVSSGQSGIRDSSASTNVITSRNQIRNCATLNTAGDEFGIFAQDMTSWVIISNIISDANANMQYGIYLPGGDQTTVSVIDNQVLNSTDAGFRTKNATDAMRAYRGNLWIGTSAATFNDPPVPSIAAAGTLVLPLTSETYIITGNTGITGITANGHSGRTIKLVFTGTPTVTDGSNLKLNGNFVATADDCLTLTCVGADFHEVARSAN
jgi:hypothetical protein